MKKMTDKNSIPVSWIEDQIVKHEELAKKSANQSTRNRELKKAGDLKRLLSRWEEEQSPTELKSGAVVIVHVNNPSQVLTDYGRGLQKLLKQFVKMRESC